MPWQDTYITFLHGTASKDARIWSSNLRDLVASVSCGIHNMEDTSFYYNICCAVFSSIAFLTNLASFTYIKKSFDTSKCLYFILSIDALVVVVVSLLSLVMFSIATTVKTDSDAWFCSTLFLSSQITAITSPMCNFMISYIRYSYIAYIISSIC